MNSSTKVVIPVTELESPAFCSDDKEKLKAETLRDEFAIGVRWQKIPKTIQNTTKKRNFHSSFSV